MQLIDNLRRSTDTFNEQTNAKLIDSAFKGFIAKIETESLDASRTKTCLSVLHVLANLTVPAKATIIETLSSLQGKASSLLASRQMASSSTELMTLAALTVVCLVDIHDYHLRQSEIYAPPSKDRVLSLLTGAQATVGLDVRFECDTISNKVVQVRNENTVGEFVVGQTEDTLRHLFREVSQQEGVFWLYICVSGREQDLPLIASSR